MNNKQQKTEWRGLEIELAAFEDAIAQCVEIPNSWLPKEYQHGIDGCRTVSDLNTILERRSGLSDHKIKKQVKQENVKIYRKSLEDIAELDYTVAKVDQQQLYRNQQSFIEAMIQSGQVVLEDE